MTLLQVKMKHFEVRVRRTKMTTGQPVFYYAMILAIKIFQRAFTTKMETIPKCKKLKSQKFSIIPFTKRTGLFIEIAIIWTQKL